MFENDKATHQRTRCKVLWGSAKKRRPHRWDQQRCGVGVEPSVPHEVQDEFVWRDVQVSGNIQNLRDEVFCTPSFLGMMPRHSQSTPSPCPRSVPGSSPIGWCPEHFTQDSSWWDTRTTSTGSFRWWGLVGRLFAPPRVPHPIPEAEPRHPWAESHFSCFYPPPHSFYHHWRFVAISQ